MPDAFYVAPGVKTCVSDLIRRRAYELFEEHGRQSGHDVEDWLQAEREIENEWGDRDAYENNIPEIWPLKPINEPRMGT